MKDKDFHSLISLHNDSVEKLPDKFFYKKKFANCTIPAINDLSGYPLQDSVFTNVIFVEIQFSSAFLYGSKFDSCVFSKCSFVKAELGGVSIMNSVFNGCNFFRTSINNAVIQNSLIVSSNLDRTILSETELISNKIEYYGVPIKNELKEENTSWIEIEKPPFPV